MIIRNSNQAENPGFRPSQHKIAHITDVSLATSIEDVLQASQTNWEAEIVDAMVTTDDRIIGNGGFRAIVRPDTNECLAFVGQRYRTNNHVAQLMGLDQLIRSGDLLPVTVSVWDNGAVLAYQFQATGLSFNIHGVDKVSPLLTLAFSYGSTLADTAFFCDFRWFCSNQMGRVAKLTADGRVKHRGEVKAKFSELVGRRIAEVGGELAPRYEAMRRMTNSKVENRALFDYFGASLGCSREEADKARIAPKEDLTGNAAKIPEVLDCYLEDDCGAPGTVWQAYNAVTRYQTHKAGRTAETRQRRMLLLESGEKALETAWEEAVKLAA